MGDAVAFILGPFVVPDVTNNSTNFLNNSMLPSLSKEDVKIRDGSNKTFFYLPWQNLTVNSLQ